MFTVPKVSISQLPKAEDVRVGERVTDVYCDLYFQRVPITKCDRCEYMSDCYDFSEV